MRYYVLIEDHQAGQRKRRWHSDPATGSAFTSKRAADAHCASLVTSRGQGTYVPPSVMTVGEWLAIWLEQARDRLKLSSWASYEKNVRVHIVPVLGQVRLQELTTHQVDQFYVSLRHSGRATKRGKGDPLAPRTVKYVHTILSAALDDAVAKGLLVRNPVKVATSPRDTTTSATWRRTWTAKELADFLAGVQDHRLGPVFSFLALTGCRRGEALGLRWRDVDLAGRRAVIRQQIGKVGGQVVETDSTKGGSGRSIALDPGLVALLESHRARQDGARALLGPGYEDRDLVFANEDGSVLYPEGLSRVFVAQASRLGLRRIRLHDLRHTWATLALQNGVHPRVVQERLGHANITITLQTYSHVIPTMHDQAADLVAGVIASAGQSNVVPLRKAVDRR
jgi:integrase